MANLLLENGADINFVQPNGHSILFDAVLNPEPALDFSMMGFPLDNGADVNSRSKVFGFVVHVAVEQHNIQVVRLLLERGTDTKLRNPEGLTALEVAEVLGSWEMLELFRRERVLGQDGEPKGLPTAMMPARERSGEGDVYTVRSRGIK